MRTTVTLDEDVERALKDSMRRHSKTFKQALNDAIRQGLAKSPSPQGRKKFVVTARPMGLRSGIDPAKLSDLAIDLEIDAFQATSLKLGKQAR